MFFSYLKFVYEEHVGELLKLEVAHEVIIEDMDAHLAEGQRDLEHSRKQSVAESVTAVCPFVVPLWFVLTLFSSQTSSLLITLMMNLR